MLDRADNGVATTQTGNEITYRITEPKIIAQLSDSEDLPDEMELTDIPAKKAPVPPISTSPILNSYELRKINNQGDGWYNSDEKRC